ncbi:MAG: NACHT domain-containing protein [Candidatus Solibacter usitatus]|nr:NACHT domain-containing protein [Candidatus Solibacter usitatus]
MQPRDDFSATVKGMVAARAGYRCSICRGTTVGPDSTDGKVNVGVAAHITAASPGGPRYDPTQTPEERASLDNAIWLCQNHAHLIDVDTAFFTTSELRRLKGEHEDRTGKSIGLPDVRQGAFGTHTAADDPAGNRAEMLARRLEIHSALALDDAALVATRDTSGLGEIVRLDQGLYTHRDIEESLMSTLLQEDDACVLLTGDAGNGKTSLLWRLCTRLQKTMPAFKCFFLKSTLLRSTSQAEPEGASSMTPEDVLTALTDQRDQPARTVLLLDTADLLLHDDRGREALVFLLTGLRSRGCAVVVASRPQEAAKLAKMADGSFLLEKYNEIEMAQAIDAHCRCFYRDALDDTATLRIRHLQEIVVRGLPLREICATPLTLRMLFTLYAPESVPEEIHAFQLYDAFWRRRVVADARAGYTEPVSFENLEQTAIAVALAMTAEGLPEIPERMAQLVLDQMRMPVRKLDLLCSRGVLRRSPGSTIAFFHQTFFEHAAARAFLRAFPTDALDLLAQRLALHDEDLFLSPVYEHALLLTEFLPGSSRKGDEHLLGSFRQPSILRRISAVYVYCHRQRLSTAVMAAVDNILRDEDHTVVEHFLHNAVNWPGARVDDLFAHVTTVWERARWSERQHILALLERLAFRRPQLVVKFVEAANVQEYVKNLPADYPGERLFLRVILAIARFEPEWSWDRLITLVKNHGKTISLDLVTRIVTNIGELTQVFHRPMASELTEALSAVQRNEVRGYHDLTRALGKLWAAEWIDQAKSLDSILEELGPGVMAYAKFRGVGEWLRAVCAPPIDRVLKLAEEAPPNESWLWLSCVILTACEEPIFPSRKSVLDQCGVWLLSTWTTRQYQLLDQALRALLNGSLQSAVVQDLFSAAAFAKTEPWLDSRTLGPYLAHGLIAKHPGAIAAIEWISSHPTEVPPEIRESLLSRLTNRVATDERLANVYLTTSLSGPLPAGFAAGLSSIADSFPAVVASFASALESTRAILLDVPSSRLRAIATVIWKCLIEQRLVPAPELPPILSRLDREKSWDVRAGLVSVLAVGACRTLLTSCRS